jgi:ribosomal protein S18 acetylase RimI-like enzyme
VGRRLLDEALARCGRRGFRLAWPETLADLDAAGALYARAGVRVAEERDGARWGSRARERRLVLDLGPGPG